MEDQVTHSQIYARLLEVEAKVDSIDKNTKGLVEAIHALDGAFKVLGSLCCQAYSVGGWANHGGWCCLADLD
jgi:hypothetical protein